MDTRFSSKISGSLQGFMHVLIVEHFSQQFVIFNDMLKDVRKEEQLTIAQMVKIKRSAAPTILCSIGKSRL